MTSTAQQQQRPNGAAAIIGIVLFVIGLILLFNGVPALFGAFGQLPSYAAFMGFDRAVETLLPYAILPIILTIAGLIMVVGGFRMLRRQSRQGAQWARSEWQERQPEVQQRFRSAREQLQSQGASVWDQTQQRTQQAAGWSPQQQAQSQRQGWPGQPAQQQLAAQRHPAQQQQQQSAQQPQAHQPQPRQQQSRGSSTLERMQQRIADAATATDRAHDAAMAKHEQQAAALQQRAERAAEHVAPQYAEPGISFGSPELVTGRRASSILASSSLRSTSLSRTSLSLHSLRQRR